MNFDPNQDRSGAASDPVQTAVDWAKKHWRALAVAVVGLLLAVVVPLSVLGFNNRVNDDGNRRQNDVATLYRQAQTELSTCLDTTLISAQVAQAERASLRETLAAALSARYTSDGGQQVTVESASIVLKSIQEAYPSISDALFKQLMTNAVGCRNQTAGSFQKLQKFAGDYLTWTQTGGTFERTIRNNYPTDNLKVKGVGGESLTGMAALEHLVEPILTADAAQAVQTHQMPEQQLFPSGSATK